MPATLTDSSLDLDSVLLGLKKLVDINLGQNGSVVVSQLGSHCPKHCNSEPQQIDCCPHWMKLEIESVIKRINSSSHLKKI